jgi:VanZ family protein
MLAILFTCFFGYYLEYYLRSKTFDRYLHTFGSFSFAQLSFCILDDFIDTNSSKIFRSAFIFLLGNTIGIIYELIEAKLDTTADIKNQKGLKDTNMDLLFDMVGSLLASVVAYFWLF